MAAVNQEQQQPTVATIAGNAVGDQPSEHDALGFTPYVEAVAAFLTSTATKPPLTMSIEGEWGSGKSSFMLQLRRAIRGASRTESFIRELPEALGGISTHGSLASAIRAAFRPKQRITIQFNAWRHDKQDALWAAFALQFAKSLRKQAGFIGGLRGDISLFFRRLQSLRGWCEVLGFALLLFCLAVSLVGTFGYISHHNLEDVRHLLSIINGEKHDTGAIEHGTHKTDAPSQQLPRIYEFLLSRGPWGSFLAVVLLCIVKFHKYLKPPISLDIQKYLTKPNYQSRVSFIEEFHEDFGRTLRAYARNERVFTFIDDLDRCDVPRAAELIQAINLMIADTGELVFVLGMDRDKVAAGITQKYKDLLPFIPEFAGQDNNSQASRVLFGYAYLEKFIQLSFILPVMSGDEALKHFLSNLGTMRDGVVWRKRLADYWASRRRKLWSRTHSSSNETRVPKNLEAAVKPDAALIQEERIRYLRVKVDKDSDRVLNIVAMVAPIFANNPRRLKQFVNAFRLALYLSSEQGMLDERNTENSVTPEQLGKFIALSLKLPDLRSRILQTHDILADIELRALVDTRQMPDWISSSAVAELLRYRVSYESPSRFDDKDPYSLRRFPALKFMSILPKVPVNMSIAVSNETEADPADMDFLADAVSAIDESEGKANLYTQRAATDSIEFTDSANAIVSETQTPTDSEKRAATVVSDSSIPTEEGSAIRSIDSRLSRFDPAGRTAYEEALRLLSAEGTASEYFALLYLKEKGIAQNWANIFEGMKRATNLVQIVPGQPSNTPQDQLEWQIKPEFRTGVAGYLAKRGSASPVA